MLKINNRSKTGKFKNLYKLNNKLLNNKWIQEEITKEIGNYLEMSENKNSISKLVGWDATKVVLREKFIAVKTLKNKNDLKSIK